jgi:hypothetical protein
MVATSDKVYSSLGNMFSKCIIGILYFLFTFLIIDWGVQICFYTFTSSAYVGPVIRVHSPLETVHVMCCTLAEMH